MSAQYELNFNMRGSGFKVKERAGETLGEHKLVYRGADGFWWLADADNAATMPVLGITMGAVGGGQKGEILEWGRIGDTNWAWTAGTELYASTIPGELTQIAPTGVGDVIQVVAIAATDVMIEFQGHVGGKNGKPWDKVTEASYIVFTDGTTIYAKNGITGQIDFSGPSFSTVAQSTISLGGKIVFKGTFTKTTIPGLLVPSGTEIEVPAGSTITFGNNVGDGAAIFNLSSVSQVTIWGAGTLDGNLAGQAGGSQNAVVMSGATQCRVDVYMENFRGLPVVDDGYNIAVNRCYPNAVTDLPDFNGLMAAHPNVEIVDHLENGEGWSFQVAGGTSLAWSDDRVHSGDQSLKFGLVGTQTAFVYDYDHFAANPIDLTKKSIGVWINFDSLAADGDIVVRYYLYAPNTSHYIYGRTTYRPLNRNPNQWVYVGFIPQAYYKDGGGQVGSPDITNIQGIRVDVYTGGTTFNVYVDSITVVDHMFPNGAVVLGFDGPQSSQFENAFPIMQERNLKGVMWAVTDWVDSVGYPTTDNLKTLQAAGWDIASHGSEMLDYATATLGEVDATTAKAKDWLVSNGFQSGARFFSYPFGTNSLAASEVVKKYHILARAIVSANNLPGLPLFDPAYMICLPAKGVLATAKLEIDNLALTGGLGMYYWHNIQTPKQAGELTIAEFEELMDYIVASGVKVITLSEIVDKYLITYPTGVETISIGVKDPDTYIGTHPALLMPDDATTTVYAQFEIPDTFHQIITAHAIIVPAASGNMRRSAASNWGKIGFGDYNENNDSIAAGQVAVIADKLEAIDISTLFTGVAAGDLVGFTFVREGADGNDTVDDDCYYLGAHIRYV